MPSEITAPFFEMKTVDLLRSYLSEVLKQELTDENLIWANCLFEASSIIQSYTTKDLASSLQEGLGPLNKLSDVQNTLDTFFEDELETDNCGAYVVYIIGQVYGQHELANSIEERLEELNPSGDE